MADAWVEAKRIAQEGRYLDADMYIGKKARERYKEMYGKKFSGNRPRYDRAHPGFHFLVSTDSNGTDFKNFEYAGIEDIVTYGRYYGRSTDGSFFLVLV